MCLRVQRRDASVRHKNPVEIEAFCTEHLNFQKLGWHRNRVLRNLNTERFGCQIFVVAKNQGRTKKAKQQAGS